MGFEPMQKLIILIFLLCAFWTDILHAQNKHELPAANFLNEQLSAQLLNQTIALSDPTLVKAQAMLLRKQYDALIEVGFSKEEAMRIVVAMASRDKE